MNLKSRLEITFIFFTSLIIIYNFIITAETLCFDRFSMTLSLFALTYTIFLKII